MELIASVYNTVFDIPSCISANLEFFTPDLTLTLLLKLTVSLSLF